MGWLAGCRVMWLIVMMACLQLVRLAGCPATSQTGRLAEWKGEDWLPGGVVGLLPGGVALDDWGCGGGERRGGRQQRNNTLGFQDSIALTDIKAILHNRKLHSSAVTGKLISRRDATLPARSSPSAGRCGLPQLARHGEY